MENPDHPAHRPDLCSHASRVLTFKCKKTTSKALRWPHPDSFALTPTILASAGYFHNPDEREPDRTTCWMCGESTRDWQSSDDPWSVHLEWAPNCPFARIAILDRQRDTQVPSWPDMLHQPWGPTPDWFPRGQLMIEARLATFCGKDGQWRHEGVDGVPTRLELARAGFHFAPNSFKKGRKLEVDDTTSCCYCRRTVSEWEAGDDPVAIHLKKGQCIFFTTTPPPPTTTKPEPTKKIAAPASKKVPSSRTTRGTTVDDDQSETAVSASAALGQSRGTSRRQVRAPSSSGTSSRPTRRGNASAATSPTRERSPVGNRELSPPTRSKHPRAVHKPPVSLNAILSSPDPLEISIKPPVSMPQTTRLSRSTSRAPSATRSGSTQPVAPRTRSRGASQSSMAADHHSGVTRMEMPNTSRATSNAGEEEDPKARIRTNKTANKLLVSISAPTELVASKKSLSSRQQQSELVSNITLDSGSITDVNSPDPTPQPPRTTQLSKSRKAATTKSNAATLPGTYQEPDSITHSGPSVALKARPLADPGSSAGYDRKAPQLYTGVLPVASKSTRTPNRETEANQTLTSAPPPALEASVIDEEANALVSEYFGGAPATIPEGWLANPYNASRPFPPLSEAEAAMGLEEYFAYRADQEEAAFLAWVEEKRMRPWLKRVEEGRQMIEELMRTGTDGKMFRKQQQKKEKEKRKKKKKDQHKKAEVEQQRMTNGGARKKEPPVLRQGPKRKVFET